MGPGVVLPVPDAVCEDNMECSDVCAELIPEDVKVGTDTESDDDSEEATEDRALDTELVSIDVIVGTAELDSMTVANGDVP